MKQKLSTFHDRTIPLDVLEILEDEVSGSMKLRTWLINNAFNVNTESRVVEPTNFAKFLREIRIRAHSTRRSFGLFVVGRNCVSRRERVFFRYVLFSIELKLVLRAARSAHRY